jgi:response regulator RpfG family c-di-GMP phosphodiesterase
MEIMMAGRGTHFDPDLLDCFIDCLPEILTLKSEFADG